MAKEKLGTEPYKGVRDFYPDDMRVQKALFERIRAVSESFGYEEYHASVLEPTELYTSKTSEEIVNEQTYTFKDRADRSVTLRPEMTPTVARMVAAKKRELSFPLRWYSIPNVFRYERPQHGRLREHWQFNCDIFGVAEIEADAEIAMLAHAILTSFGATEKDFEIKLHSRTLLNAFYAKLGLEAKTADISRLIDRKNKMEKTAFTAALTDVAGDHTSEIEAYLNAKTIDELPESIKGSDAASHLKELFAILADNGISNAVFDPTVVRGFDYYTGTVYEVFDTSPENNRAMLGGGRYDNLLSNFSDDSLPAVGIAMGDVTLLAFLESRNLLPKVESSAQVFVAPLSKEQSKAALKVAQELRAQDVSVVTYLGGKKISDQIALADKQNIPFVIAIGDDEVASSTYKAKHLASKEEQSGSISELAAFIKSR